MYTNDMLYNWSQKVESPLYFLCKTDTETLEHFLTSTAQELDYFGTQWK